MSPWTPARVAEAMALLRDEPRQNGALRSVAEKLSAAWGLEVTESALRSVLQRRKLPSVAKLAGTRGDSIPLNGRAERDTEPSAAPPVDPVVQHIERRREARARDDRKELLERLAVAEERVRVLDAISVNLPPASVKRRERAPGVREATAVALASDWHVEETVDPDKIEGLNKYDLTIAEARIGRFFEGFEWLIGYHRQAFTVRDAVLWLGGDLLSGFIHEELLESNELSPAETVLFLRRHLRDGIKRLLTDKGLERLIVPCNYGNHGRTTERKRINTGAQNSFEWLLYNVLAGDFAEEPRVRFLVAQGEHCYVNVYDFVLHFTHGDSVNYGGGVGGISIPVNKAVASWNTVKRAHYHNFGHFHQRLEGRDWNANGSLIGYSPYAFHVKAQFEPPQQSFYLVDSRRGRCQSTPIWVSGDHEERAA